MTEYYKTQNRKREFFHFFSLLIICFIVIFSISNPVSAFERDDSGVIGKVSTNQLDNTNTVYLPLICNGWPPVDTIQNGGFELGHIAWNEYSMLGFPLIVDNTQSAAPPLEGSWLAWLGGADSEISVLSQEIYIPVGRSILNFWYATYSQDTLGGDYFYVYIGDLFAGGENISTSSATNGWVRQVRDFSGFAGTTQTISFVVETNGAYNTNVFLDSVSFETSDSLPHGALSSSENTYKSSPGFETISKKDFVDLSK